MVTSTPEVDGLVDRLVAEVDRLAVLRANNIGDFLVAVPALEALRRAYPAARLTVIGNDWLPALLAGRPGPWDHAVVAPRYPGLRGLPVDAPVTEQSRRDLAAHRAERYDLALQLHGGGRTSNAVVQALGARVTAGPQTPDAPPLDRTTPYLPHRPEVLRWLEVAALVGAPMPSGPSGLVPRLAVTEGDRSASREHLPLDEAHDPFVVLHVGATDSRRCWPAERFAALGRQLARRYGLRVVLVGGAADTERSAQVASSLGGACTDLTGALPLAATLGVLARAVLLVGNDSGPRHLATAVGTPTVGIYSIANVASFGPVAGDHDRVVVSWRTACPVCGRSHGSPRCEHTESFVADVEVEHVLGPAAELLAAASPRVRR